MRRAALLPLLALAAASPGDASAATVAVAIQFQAFAPADVDVLPGDTVEWSNVSVRRHTVTATDVSFDSGDLFEGGRFAWRFDAPGIVAYHCRVHLQMTATVSVRRVTLDVLPPAAVPAGQRVTMTGRAADATAPVAIEADTGAGFAKVAVAMPRPDGTWSADVTARATADVRATVDPDASATRRLLVTDRRVRVRATRRGVHVTVTPAAPQARVVLQLRLRERFGWWPAARRRLDYLSRADFDVPHPARLRVALVDVDGWTPVATSPVVRLGASARR